MLIVNVLLALIIFSVTRTTANNAKIRLPLKKTTKKKTKKKNNQLYGILYLEFSALEEVQLISHESL
jgi:biopolymer transport protein ExbD